jgi:hypothetical protein
MWIKDQSEQRLQIGKPTAASPQMCIAYCFFFFFNALLVTDTQQSGFSCQNLAVLSRMPVAHACNPSYSGGRGQEDHSSIPAKENRSQDPISLIPNTSRAGEVVQVVQFLLASMRS